MSKPTPHIETPPTKPRKTSSLASQLYEWLLASKREEAAELARSPEEIKAKHEGRRQRRLSESRADVRELALRMLPVELAKADDE